MQQLASTQKATIKNWKETLPSTNWKMDSVLFYNNSIDLSYVRRNEFDGHYCQTYPDGRLVIGTFEMGYPNITDGIFTPRLELKLSIKDAKELQHKLLEVKL